MSDIILAHSILSDLILILFTYVCLYVCMCMCMPCVWVPKEVRKGC